MTPEETLTQLGITLPPPPAGVAAYVPWVITGNQVWTSGQLPWRGKQIAYAGRLGVDVSDDDGYQAARQCAINGIAQLKDAVGSLDRITRILRLEGFVHCGDGFRGHPRVLNGASDLFNEVFGDHGQHSRLAIGVNEMPLDAAVQLAVFAEFDPS